MHTEKVGLAKKLPDTETRISLRRSDQFHEFDGESQKTFPKKQGYHYS
jgi:hypothetical protein